MYDKKLLSIATLFLSTLVIAVNAHAINPGLYVSAGVGWGDIHQAGVSSSEMKGLIGDALGHTHFTEHSFTSTNSDPTGIAGRAALGVQFDCHWAMELGWSKFSNLVPGGHATITDHDTGLAAEAQAKGDLKTDALDFMVKGILPLPYRVSANAALGIALLEGRPNLTATVTEAGVQFVSSDNDVQRKWYPTFGLGLAYDFTPGVQGDLSWTRIQKIGDSKMLATTDLVTAGFSFHFDV